MRRYCSALLLLLTLSSCSEEPKLERPTAKQSEWMRIRERNGNLTGEDGGFVLAGGKDKNAEGGALGVNSYLWRATLDTLSFMPLASADPFGGVIITDWYEDPKTPGERFKVNALILDKSLRPDGINITVFKQKLDKSTWRDKKVDDTLEKSLEDTILTRARELRVQQIK
ncbi:MAG: DUF3576 domain-containing protein [Rickettsiales bacterium]|nr:DUF3576 domain-containing protein [Rickettsiales bacterium]